MMGRQKRVQRKLFYSKLNLDQRIPKDHILRIISKYIDFDFIYKEVKDKYGSNGNVSVPPPVILKMMLLLIFYNVRSERELMETIPVRLDWLWFLDYDLDDDIPNHSVLSKARARWGVDGSKLFMDSSNIQADASNNSVVNKEDMKRYFKKSYRLFEQRLEKENANMNNNDLAPRKSGTANKKHFSTTDPEASVHRQGGRSKLTYKVHRSVDKKREVITATTVTTGSVNEAHLLKSLIESHKKTTGIKPKCCIADSKYGTIDNYLACYDLAIKSHFESFEKTHRGSGRQKGIFAKEEFIYEPKDDVFICPEGEKLRRRRFSKQRRQFEYTASLSVCRKCSFLSQCTRSKTGRSLKRHERQDHLDYMLGQSESKESKNDIRTRQHLMERSFARSCRYGFKRARWRRIWRVQIQEYLTAAIQNVMVLLCHVKEPSAAMGMVAARVNKKRASSNLFKPHFCFEKALTITIKNHLSLQYCFL